MYSHLETINRGLQSLLAAAIFTAKAERFSSFRVLRKEKKTQSPCRMRKASLFGNTSHFLHFSEEVFNFLSLPVDGKESFPVNEGGRF